MLFFTRKKKEKLKAEIKKELLVEIKTEEEKKAKAEMEKQKIIAENRRKALNNTKEDLNIIKKEMIFGLILTVLVLIASISYLLLADKFSNKDETSKDDVDVVIPYENRKPEDLEIGEVFFHNIYTNQIVNSIQLEKINTLLQDTTSMYKNNNNLISDLPIENQMLLITNTEEFLALVDQYELDSEAKICYKEGTITIETDSIDKLLKSYLNVDKPIQYPLSFYYSYYIGNEFIIDIKFNYKDGKYISSCVSESDYDKVIKPNMISNNRVISAYKLEDKMDFYVKVVFIAETGIYKDYGLKQFVHDLNIGSFDYISLGSTYKYTYKRNNTGNYYLYSISLEEETK